MANTVTNFDLLDPKELTAALIENLPSGRFLSTRFFGEEVHGTQTIAVDILKGTRKIAPYVARGAAAAASARADYDTKFFETFNISLKRNTDAVQMFKRNEGEQVIYVGGPSTPAERAAYLLGRDQRELAEQVQRTIEKYAADALVNGKIQLKDAAGASIGEEIDFGLKATHKITVTDFMNGVEDGAAVINQDSGITATDLVMGKAFGRNFRSDSKVQKLLDMKNYVGGNLAEDLKVSNGARFLGYFGNLRVWAYDEVYATDAGVVTPFIPDNSALLLSDQMRATIHYGLINDIQGGKFATKMFSKTFEIDDPSAQVLVVKSAPLPVVEQADGYAVLSVAG
ncbi:MAG: major capsid protein [Fibrobacter sp.]|nr:major capsid protein [Fibrobacter sp.]